MSEIIICENLGVCYKDFSALKIHKIHHLIKKTQKRKKWALHDVSFTITEGDVVGIIGRNGAGKSTLTKTIAGIYRPDKGSLNVNGKVTLLSLALGFNSELSGIDNIYISGMYQGMNRKDIKSKIQEIIDFAELKEHITKPIKYYSSGMKARLAFAIATCSQPEILIIDEALATGDDSFRKKSGDRLKNIISSAKCVMIVSHSASFLRATCNKGLLLNKGSIHSYGPIEETLTEYGNI